MTKLPLRMMVQPPLAVSQALLEQVALRSAQFKILLMSIVGGGVGSEVGTAVGTVGDTVGMFVSPRFVGEAVGAVVGKVGAAVGPLVGALVGAAVGLQLAVNVESMIQVPVESQYCQVPSASLRSDGVLSSE
jgi:hypothetical protein